MRRLDNWFRDHQEVLLAVVLVEALIVGALAAALVIHYLDYFP